MKKIIAVLIVLLILGMGVPTYFWARTDNELSATRIEKMRETQTLATTSEKLASTEETLAATEATLVMTNENLAATKVELAIFDEILQLPWITEEKISRQFGIKISGEVRDKPGSLEGVKIGDYDLTPDELLIIFNVLSSLPSDILVAIEDITIVYHPAYGHGGYYDGDDPVIIGTPDQREHEDSSRVYFTYVIYHEIGHDVYFSLLTAEEREELMTLYSQSRNETDFASSYGMKNELEDFAEIFSLYSINTEFLLKKAEKSPLLTSKLKFASKFFDHYNYSLDDRGTIKRWRWGEETIWRYRSRTNPQIEILPFK